MKLLFDANFPENDGGDEGASLLGYLRYGNVTFFGYRDISVPDILQKKPASKVRIFQRGTPAKQVGCFPASSYQKMLEIYEAGGDVCFLDMEALLILLAGYPFQPRYVLARLGFRWSWLFAAPGLIRRILKKQVKLCGIITLESTGKRQKWLAIERGENTPYRHLSLSLEVGLPRFFEYLRQEGIQYVVLRFYQSLPQLHREWGDLDILVSDEDESRIYEFLVEHPGLIGVDLWAVSKFDTGQMSYYPPPLAKQILESATNGPAGSRIPALRESFLSFAYHALYHKGPASGIPSNLSGVDVNTQPENDYAGILTKMVKELGLSVNINMEDLDDYLHRHGWRPKRDTLAKIALSNEWVSYRFFNGRREEEKGLGVFILRQKAYSLGIVDSILNIIKKEGFHILRIKEFDDQERLYAADHLRGGNWSQEGEEVKQLLPAMAVVVLDAYSGLDGKGGRMESLKERLRKSFDCGGASVVHSTDTTLEAWEYIEVCFKNEATALEKEIRHISGTPMLSLKERLALYPKILNYYLKKIFSLLRRVPVSVLSFLVWRFLQA